MNEQGMEIMHFYLCENFPYNYGSYITLLQVIKFKVTLMSLGMFSTVLFVIDSKVRFKYMNRGKIITTFHLGCPNVLHVHTYICLHVLCLNISYIKMLIKWLDT